MDDNFKTFASSNTTHTNSKSQVTSAPYEDRTSQIFGQVEAVSLRLNSQADFFRQTTSARIDLRMLEKNKQSMEVKIDEQAYPFLQDYDIEKHHKQTLNKVVKK